MLRARILTSMVLITLVIFSLFALSSFSFGIAALLLMGIAAWEWAGLCEIQNKYVRFAYVIVFFVMCIASLELIPLQILLWVTLFWWLLAFVFTVSFPKLQAYWAKGTIRRAIMGFFVMVPCWITLYALHSSDFGADYILLALLIVCSADTGAYFVGMRFGKHSLAPHLSPGKTIEGALGGLMSAILVMLLFAWIYGVNPAIWLRYAALGVFTALFSILGDLFVSMLKRQCGIKDTGKILPGHGGVLDRIDSTTAALPIFTLGLLFLHRMT